MDSMDPKYEMTGETVVTLSDVTLHRIRALRSFGAVRAGDLGGFIEAERNLSHDGLCWVFDAGRVFDNGQVFGNGWVFGDGRVFGNGWVFGDGRVFGNGRVSDIPPAATRSDGYTFLILRDAANRCVVTAGCRYFSLADAREHWIRTRGGTPLGDESLAILDHLERMARIRGMIPQPTE